MAQQQADALQLLAETALHHGIDPGTPAEHYQVVVHVDARVLEDPDQPGQSVVEDGARVSYETIRALRCFVDENDIVAELFETTNVVTAEPRGVAPFEVVSAEVVVDDAVLEHVPQGDDHGVLHGDDGFLGAASRFQPMVEGAIVTLFVRMAAQATCCSVARNQVAPLPVVVGCRLPALS